MHYTRLIEFAKTIPNVITLGRESESVKTTEALRFYGYYEYTGFRKFLYKVRLGIKHHIHVNRGSS